MREEQDNNNIPSNSHLYGPPQVLKTTPQLLKKNNKKNIKRKSNSHLNEPPAKFYCLLCNEPESNLPFKNEQTLSRHENQDHTNRFNNKMRPWQKRILRKQIESEIVNVSGADNETGNGSGTDNETGNGSGTDNKTGNGSETDNKTGNGSGTDNKTGNGNGSGTDNETGNGSGTDNETGNGSGTDNETESETESDFESSSETESNKNNGNKKEENNIDGRKEENNIDTNQPIMIENEEDKIKFSCFYCGNLYSIQNNLKNHITEKHPDKENTYNEATPMALRNSIKNLEETIVIMKQGLAEAKHKGDMTLLINQANAFVEGDMEKEELRSFWIRTQLGELMAQIENAVGNTILDRNIFKLTQILEPLLKNTFFSIKSAKTFQKKPKQVDIMFSKETDVTKVFSILQKSVEDSKTVKRLFYNNNTVRVEILRLIGNHVCHGNAKKFRVKMENFQPYLWIKNKDGHNSSFSKHKFGNALAIYYNVLKLINFTECKDLCVTFSIPKNLWFQFVVLEF